MSRQNEKRPPIEHAMNARRFKCECSKVLYFRAGDTVIRCSECKLRHVRTNGFERPKESPKYERLPMDREDARTAFTVSGEMTIGGGAESLYGITEELVLECLRCQWKGNKREASPHHDKHMLSDTQNG